MFKIAKGLIKGFGKGAVDMTPLTAIIKVVKDVRNWKRIKGLLDTNNDGKLTLEDLKGLKWETLGKLLAVIAALAALTYFGV